MLIGSCLSQWNPNTLENKQTIVHLFEWKWTDITKECERFLGPYGFGGVQISPPNEHRVVLDPFRPWWERYQPVSYKLDSRSGSDAELRDMVRRCNNVGVRIYADAVINHMAQGSGIGTSGSRFGNNNFPNVPYSSWDFNTHSGKCNTVDGEISDYTNIFEVRNCNLRGLPDLDTEKEYVRLKIAEYLNKLIDIGVAGFRVDACKHMWPVDLGAIFGMLNDLNTDFFPSGSRPFIFQEVIDQGGEPIKASEYTPYGRVTEFKYGLHLGERLKLGRYEMKHLKNFGEAWGMLRDDFALVFVDNHDNQRGHGGGGNIITHENPREYKMATTFMLAYPYGLTRLMSSFKFHHDTDKGPPLDDTGNTDSVTINPDGTCGGDWVCEHRWRQIRNMVGFRNTANGQGLSNWWDNGHNQIAFGCGNKAFYVLNADTHPLSEWLYTGLPGGEYCNIILGDFNSTSGSCSGPTINVDNSGFAHFNVDVGDDPMAAIHIDARCWARTVIFVHKEAISGQDLFIRGGANHHARGIPISHNIGGSNEKFNSWKSGDDFLDWNGAEIDQGSYRGSFAEGTPLVWTTNDPKKASNVQSDGYGYTPLNEWGEHYWMVDFAMNCDETKDGWFDLKAYIQNGDGWESDLSQGSCRGSAGGTKPYSSVNHSARCGFVNVFEFGSDTCIINHF
ncbi:pancreatic alpha-amylase 2a5-like [Diadema antillarum]|uniref:pancreatic alpha-amylase 2a5-like n=1 Tax=Diadema antillarum TaxID=105358 RepID=UPI003A8482A0